MSDFFVAATLELLTEVSLAHKAVVHKAALKRKYIFIYRKNMIV